MNGNSSEAVHRLTGAHWEPEKWSVKAGLGRELSLPSPAIWAVSLRLIGRSEAEANEFDDFGGSEWWLCTEIDGKRLTKQKVREAPDVVHNDA